MRENPLDARRAVWVVAAVTVLAGVLRFSTLTWYAAPRGVRRDARAFEGPGSNGGSPFVEPTAAG